MQVMHDLTAVRTIRSRLAKAAVEYDLNGHLKIVRLRLILLQPFYVLKSVFLRKLKNESLEINFFVVETSL